TDACDYMDFIFDHRDLLGRLSTEPCPLDLPTFSRPDMTLTDSQRDLLRAAVEGGLTLPVENKHEDVKGLRRFMQQPYVHKSDEWLSLFQAEPPRGVLCRIARRLDVSLSPTNGPWQYPEKQDFREEIARMRSWYEPGRRKFRRVQDLRDDSAALLPGAPTVFTAKVKKHYAQLKTPLKEEGLWKWALVARGLHKAGVPVVSGTISVEQKWSHIKSMLPQEARRISMQWFDMLSNLCFLRLMYSHYHHGSMPSWTDNDTLLSHKLDGLIALAQCLSNMDGVLDEIPSNLASTVPLEAEGEGDLAADTGASASAVFWDPELVEEAFGVQFPSKVHMRVLHTKWARAMAQGLKWVETQRYRPKSLNAMKFAQAGEWVVLGDSQHIMAIGVCAGKVVRGCRDILSSGVLDHLDESLRADLESYLNVAQSFDYITFSSVCNLTAGEPIPWKSFWSLQSARNPKNKQGFPRVGGPDLAPALFLWTQQLGAEWITPYGNPGEESE
ncbi:unnamed protein product, partial [Durusdinium trenchii]